MRAGSRRRQHAGARGRRRRLGRQHRHARGRRRGPGAVRRPGRPRRRSSAAARPPPRSAAGAGRPRLPHGHAAGARRRQRAAETLAAVAAGTRPRPRSRCGSLAGDPADGDVLVSTVPAAAQDAGAGRRLRRACRWSSTCVYDPWPTPLAPPPRRTGRSWSAGSTCSCTRRCCRSSCSPGVPAPLAAMRAAGERALAARRGRRVRPRT